MAHQPRSRYDELYPIFRWRTYLGWAVTLSILFHLTAGPVVGRFHLTSESPPEHVTRVSVERLVTPRPTPPPTPTPHPTTTPSSHATAPPAKLRLEPPKQTVRAASHNAQPRYVSSKNGVTDPHGNIAENGTANSNGNARNGPAAAPVSPPTPPTPSPTPKPACAEPNAEARAIVKANPEYPSEEALEGITGTAEITVDLNAKGGVTSVAVLRSSGSRELDRAAMAAARATTYSAEVRDCEPTAGTYRFISTFAQR